MSDRRLLLFAVCTWLAAVLASVVACALMRPRHYYFRMDSAPMRVETDSGAVELLNPANGKWVSWQMARKMMEKK